MDVVKVLENFKSLLIKEKSLLIKGIVDEETTNELSQLEKKKLDILSELSQLDVKALKQYSSLLREIEQLNKEIESLILNNLHFIESILKEIFPERETVYGSDGKNLGEVSIFNRKI
ncbi:hypothetical protein GFV12_02265 [Desulfurobacterium thermolithotrophum]|uniref:hypothetical protein n=1 Tax=Desulfurobacterium thermolithotrophum TaxID=64160 RepID=UPI0013D82740|nr:hypothetical protein [Desulfurobacterium thermolithotrophum]